MNFYERNLLDLEHYINELETWLVDAENNEAEMSDLAYIVAQINDVAVEFEAIRINLKTMLEYIDKAKEVRL